MEILYAEVERGPSELAVCDKSRLALDMNIGAQCGCILGSPHPQALVGVETGAVTAGVRWWWNICLAFTTLTKNKIIAPQHVAHSGFVQLASL
jgi:hypothetical protein